MNIADRSLRLLKAFIGLRDLDRSAASLTDRPAELISLSFAYCDHFLRPIQIEEELKNLLDDVIRLRPRTVLEIGTSMGGTLYLWTRLAEDDATIVSVDLPGGKFGGGYSTLRTPIYRRFRRSRQALHLLRSNSHDPATLAEVKRLFGGKPIDLLFIDGDHTYEGVKQDWELYSPLVREGGLVVFHDVAGNYGDTQVKRFWDSLSPAWNHREYSVHPRGHYGIGVIFK